MKSETETITAIYKVVLCICKIPQLTTCTSQFTMLSMIVNKYNNKWSEQWFTTGDDQFVKKLNIWLGLWAS